ncbi:hypothetical protein ACEQPO_21820 [Bacillus sp. SL00103]
MMKLLKQMKEELQEYEEKLQFVQGDVTNKEDLKEHGRAGNRAIWADRCFD